MDFVIDFERINKLISHPLDGKDYTGISVNNTTKKLISTYINIYMGYKEGKRGINEDQFIDSVNNLRYNKILIDKSDIRDQKIESILKTYDE